MCVAIDQAVDIDAPLPFPLSSSCQYVGDAVRSHVNWPTSFIKVQHEKQCKKKSGNHEQKLELNSSRYLPMTRTDTQFLENQLENRARALADRLFDTPPNTAILVPCIVGFHWILIVINVNKDIVYMVDPLGHRLRSDDWKHVIDMAMKMFHAVENGKKGRSKTSWEIVNAHRQPDSNQCGFYVMTYMRTLIEHMLDINDKESVQALLQKADYNQMDIDLVRSEWAGSYVF
nr:putative Ulp1 protease family catalytic domain-containing protein [Ipomoea batatas]